MRKVLLGFAVLLFGVVLISCGSPKDNVSQELMGMWTVCNPDSTVITDLYKEQIADRKANFLAANAIDVSSLKMVRDGYPLSFGIPNVEKIKILSKGKFSCIEISRQSQLVASNFVGTYTYEDGIYTEYIECATAGYSFLSGTTHKYTIEVGGGFMTMKGVDSNFLEVWKKIE